MLLEEMLPGENLENSTTEFKGIIREGNGEEIKWLRTLAAFANTQGGRLFIGVEDRSHKVVALDHRTADQVSLMIHRQVRDKVDPALDYDMRAYPLPGSEPTRYILCVEVSQSKNLPVTVHANGMLGIYIRRFGRTETASSEQLRELVLQSDNVPFDRPFTPHRYEKGDFTRLLSLHKERTGEDLESKELISMGFMSADGRLSKGALLFADDCADERTRMTLTHWPGDTKGSDTVLASQDYVGDLLGGIEIAQEFVSAHSANGFRKTERSRDEYIAYPPRSVTEGIVNAVGHRNYFISGSQIEVNVFKDRLEITSPGSLLGVRQLKREHDIASIVPRRRNEVVCDVLTSCKLMEEKGSGFDKIEEDYAGRGRSHAPFVSSDSTSFTLTLPDLTYEMGVIGDGNECPEVATRGIVSVRGGLEVLSYCYRQDRTAAQIAGHLGLTPSTYFRRTVLDALVEQGYLIKREGGRAAVYTANLTTVFLR